MASLLSMQSLTSLIQKPKVLAYDDVPEALNSEASSLIEQALRNTQQSLSPIFIHLCGIPGSGKSTYAQKFVQSHPGTYWVQFDAVMEALPSYRNDRELKGLADAFLNWELPARTIGYHLLQALLENRRNVLFDHSAACAAHLDLIDQAKSWGYRVEMHYLPCPPEIAQQRVQAREKLIQRHTPETLIWERHQVLTELLPHYRAKADRFLTRQLPQNVDMSLRA